MKISRPHQFIMTLRTLGLSTLYALLVAFVLGQGGLQLSAQETTKESAPAEKSEKDAAKKEDTKEGKEKAEVSPFFKNPTFEDPDLYVIRPADKVEVKVFNEADLDRSDLTVDEAGRVNLELIGRVTIAGKTVKDAQALITKMYDADFLIDPLVRLTVLEKAKRRFVILGQVRNPGFFEVPRSLRLDILQALALAGGYTRIAGKVTHKRTTRDGEEVKRYSIKQLKRMKQSELPMIFEDDTVIVEESFF